MEKFDIKNRKGKSLPKEIQSLSAYMNGVKYLSVARLSRANMFEIHSYRNYQLSLSTAIDTNIINVARYRKSLLGHLN